MARVVETDNFNREIYAEHFVSGSISDAAAKELTYTLNKKESDFSEMYYKVVPDDYILFKGFQG